MSVRYFKILVVVDVVVVIVVVIDVIDVVVDVVGIKVTILFASNENNGGLKIVASEKNYLQLSTF